MGFEISWKSKAKSLFIFMIKKLFGFEVSWKEKVNSLAPLIYY